MAADVKPGKGVFVVSGAAVVVRTLNGSERYLYKGARFDAAQVDAANVEHLQAVGLVSKADAKQAGAKAPAKQADADAKPAADAKAGK